MEKHISYVFLLKKKALLHYMAFEDHSLRKKTFRLFFYFKNCLHYIVFEDHSLRRTKHFVDFQIKKNCAIQPFVMGKTCRVFFYLNKKGFALHDF